MKRYVVIGTTTLEVRVEVEAEGEEEAVDAAAEIVPCLTSYVGNGGTGKLMGLDAAEATIDGGLHIEWDEAREK